jgi:hypothetical protein
MNRNGNLQDRTLFFDFLTVLLQKSINILVQSIGASKGRGAAGLQPPTKRNLKKKKKKTDSVDTMILKVLYDLRFSLNQLPKFDDD